MDGIERLKALIEADPAAAQKLLVQINSKRLIPHGGGQQEVYDCATRFQILDAGRRWGKTRIGAAKAIRAARKERQMIWWVAPTYKIVKRGYREVVRQLQPELLSAPPPADSAFDAGRSVILKFKNGTRMEFYSAERPEGMLGEGVDFAVLDEAAIMGKNIWEQIVRPTLMDRQGGALMISTPRGRNWFYQMWLRGQDEAQENYASWKFPSWTNPTLAPGEIEEMEASLPRLIYEQEVMAEFISKASAVFRFEPDEVMRSLVKPAGHVVLGIDLARTNDFTVILGANAGDRQNCYYERFNDVAWREQRRRIHFAVRKVIREGASAVTLMVDSTGVGDPTVEELEAEGLDVNGLNFTTWKQKMVMRLGHDLEHGAAFLLPDRVEEFEDYTMTITDGGKYKYSAPAGQHDDVVSAKLLQHWGIASEGTPQVTVLSPDAEPVEEPEEEWGWIDDDEAEPEPEEIVLIPDSAEEIMARDSAWN